MPKLNALGSHVLKETMEYIKIIDIKYNSLEGSGLDFTLPKFKSKSAN